MLLYTYSNDIFLFLFICLLETYRGEGRVGMQLTEMI